ncbi:nitrilase-related carbon-nitrogen hydrolase [Nocardioides aquiterrae]|uniref:Nitrilase family protein n=1 Tax=Nocardioides aquiterrae TaxID=203799 RepID=A0ABP4EZ82_9ACTN
MIVVAACQLAPALGDAAANRDRVAAAVEDAAGRGAELVVLPELVSSGYAFEDRAEAWASAEDVDGSTVQAWRRLAADRGVVLVGGLCERSGDSLFNSAVVVDPSGVRAVYRKAHLWDRERLIFDAGDQAPPVVETRVGRLSTMVCYDLEFPEWVRIPALAGAQILAAPVNWPAAPAPPGERPAEVVRAQADAAVNRLPIVAADRVGVERGVAWVGGTVVTDADGWVVAGGWSSEEEAVVLAELDPAQADDKRIGGLSDIHADRRADLYPTSGWVRPLT